MNKYNLENLIPKFAEHSKKFEITNKEHLEVYPNRDPEQDWDFNLSEALHQICLEIKELKQK